MKASSILVRHNDIRPIQEGDDLDYLVTIVDGQPIMLNSEEYTIETIDRLQFEENNLYTLKDEVIRLGFVDDLIRILPKGSLPSYEELDEQGKKEASV